MTSDALAVENAFEKYIHGISAASVNTEYGTPSDGIFARRPKITVKITIVSNGCSTAHAAPSAVCAYCTLMSRHTRNTSSSRFAHSSPTLIDGQLGAGSITMVGSGPSAAKRPMSDSGIRGMNLDCVFV